MAANGVGTQWVQNVAYDYAGRRTSLQRYLSSDGMGDDVFTTETMNYNVNGQLSSLTWSGVDYGPSPSYGLNYGANGGTITYTYSATQNNGQITQVTDTVSGETIAYEYDALKRLTLAVATPVSGGAPAWTQGYTYDGFRNLTAKVLNGASTPIAVTAQTNRLTNSSYDSNGNMLTGVGATFSYDERNRMLSAAATSGGTEYYAYAPDNKRIYRLEANGTVEQWMLYGARGEKVGVYCLWCSGGSYSQTEGDVWFAGKLIWNGWPGLGSGGQIFEDRLGTNRLGGAQFYPYGDEIGSTAGDRVKFATYNRDSFTTLDYADQRYYASSYGRFNTVDPMRTNIHLNNPGSWNSYAYGNGDPVGNNDRRGLSIDSDSDGTSYCSQFPDDPECAVCLEVPDSPGCIGDSDDGPSPTPPPPSPKCWQNVGNVTATLNNLGTDIEADVETGPNGAFSAADLQLLTADINSDVASEMTAIGGGTTASPYYIGGHFNLTISATQIAAFSTSDQQTFSADFWGGTNDGIRQDAVTGLAAAGGYTLHSHGGANAPFSFHFDRFNPQDVAGLAGHFGYDVVGGHLGHPCLDPAWH